MNEESFAGVSRACQGGCIRWRFCVCLGLLCCAGWAIDAGPVVEWIRVRPIPSQATTQTLMYDGIAVVALYNDGGVLYYAPDGTWQGSKLPTTHTMHAGIYAMNRFVAAGDSGAVLTSSDGLVWNERITGTDANLLSVVAAGPTLFALGEGGIMVWSDNGIDWSLSPAGTSHALRAATYGDGMYVVVGDAGTILTSTDGIDWARQESGTEEPFGNVVFGNGMFVAQGPHWVAISEDGVQWSIRQPQGPDRDDPDVTVRWTLRGLAFGNGYFALSSDSWVEVRQWGIMEYTIPEVFVSADGIEWNHANIFQPVDQFGTLGQVVFGNNVFVTPGPSGVYRSDNGLNWELVPGSPHVPIRFESGRFLRLHPWPATSLDGARWTDLPPVPAPDPTRDLHEVVFANDQFVIAGAGINLVSNDGLLWQWQFHETDLDAHQVASGNGVFVAVSPTGSLITSTDGLGWAASSPTLPAAFVHVGFIGAQFIAVGNSGAIATSPDGWNWTQRESGVTSNLVNLATDGSQVIAIGDAGTVLSSDEGVAWSRLITPATGNLQAVAWGNGRWLILEPAENRALIWSTDGRTWFKEGLAEWYFIPPLRYEGDRFWVVARGAAWPSATVLGSSDGIHWSPTPREPQAYFSVETGISDYLARKDMVAAVSLPGVGPGPGSPWYQGAIHVVSWRNSEVAPEASQFPFDDQLWSIAYGRGRFVAVGDSGVILVSNLIEPLLTLEVNPTTGKLYLLMRGSPDKLLRLEFSPDLVNWTELGTHGNADPPLELELPSGTGAMNGFYRAIQAP